MLFIKRIDICYNKKDSQEEN